MITTEGTTVNATRSRTARTTPTSDTTATLVLMAGLAITAVLTPIHGEAGTAAEIGARSEWVPIHVGQLFSYFLIAIGAVAYSMAPRRSGLARTATVFLSLGATLAALAHIVDGPVRVSMIDAGLADGAQLYDAMILMATWMIVPGYVFMGVGGALFAWTVAANTGGAARLVAVVVLVLSLIGSTAGWGAELLGVIPGAVFLAFTLSWIWMAVVLGRELRGPAAPETVAATLPAAGR